MLKKPPPRRDLRLPVWPSMVSENPASGALGLVQRFGPPAPETAGALWALTVAGMGLPLGVANELSSQSVDHRDPALTENGSPEVCRQVPLNSQPPTNASRILLRPEPNV